MYAKFTISEITRCQGRAPTPRHCNDVFGLWLVPQQGRDVTEPCGANSILHFACCEYVDESPDASPDLSLALAKELSEDIGSHLVCTNVAEVDPFGEHLVVHHRERNAVSAREMPHAGVPSAVADGHHG